jgi:hypothetical protein
MRFMITNGVGESVDASGIVGFISDPGGIAHCFNRDHQFRIRFFDHLSRMDCSGPCRMNARGLLRLALTEYFRYSARLILMGSANFIPHGSNTDAPHLQKSYPYLVSRSQLAHLMLCCACD